MVQRRSGSRLLHKALHSIRVSSNISGQNLQRNFAIKFRVLGQINLAHPACADLGDDAVMRERGIGGKVFGHWVYELSRRNLGFERMRHPVINWKNWMALLKHFGSNLAAYFVENN